MIEPTYLEADATFDPARVYRYTLLRRWAPGPTVLWIMLNPSTADEVKLDPTLQRCLGFTRAFVTGAPWVSGADFDVLARSRRAQGDSTPERFGAFEVCNLYAFRSSNPKRLWATEAVIEEPPLPSVAKPRRIDPPPHGDPVGPDNDAAILAAAKRAELVIVGWGDNAKPDRERRVAQLLADAGVQPFALRLCGSGAPSHPLARGRSRIPDDAKPFPWHAKGLR